MTRYIIIALVVAGLLVYILYFFKEKKKDDNFRGKVIVTPSGSNIEPTQSSTVSSLIPDNKPATVNHVSILGSISEVYNNRVFTDIKTLKDL